MRNIMSNMRYNIKSALSYLTELTGSEIVVRTTSKTDAGYLPLAISNGYGFYDIDILNNRVTLAIPNVEDDSSPMLLAKHQAKMIEVWHRPVAFVLERVESYNLTRLTRAKVDFIVPGKIIFMPSMMMVLRDVKNTAKALPDKMPPVAQLLFLYHLQVRRLDGMNTAAIADMTAMAYSTINQALKWLALSNFVELRGGKQKQVQFKLAGRELWDKALPMMTTPVERVDYTDMPLADTKLAGETAMGQYTLLAEPMTPVVAISKQLAREKTAILNKEYGETKVEVWKYNPALLAKGDCVDRLSLYLSLKDSDDERVQMECDTLLNDMEW